MVCSWMIDLLKSYGLSILPLLIPTWCECFPLLHKGNLKNKKREAADCETHWAVAY